MCKKQTSVSHSSTESQIISLDAGLGLDGIPALDLWDLIVAILGNTYQNHTEQGDLLKNQREICSPPHTFHKRKHSRRVINDLDNVDFILSNVQSSHQEALLHVFEDNEAVIKMIIKKEEAREWDTFPEPTELRLIGCSIESSWTPRSKSNILTPKTNSQTYWPRETSHVMNGIIFCVCLTLAIQFYRLFSSDVEKNAKGFRWRKSHSRIETDDEFGLAMQRKDFWCATFYYMWTAHLTRHMFSCFTASISMSHRHWLKFGVQRTFHSIPSSCAHDVVVLTLCGSPFHILLSTFPPIVFFSFLIFTFFFQDVGDKYPAHPR